MTPQRKVHPPGHAALIRQARVGLRDAWHALVAAGRITDAAEVEAIRKRLEAER